MRSLFVMGKYGSGKTAICLGLALKFQEQGVKVGFFKPIGAPEGITGRPDDDAVLMKHLLKMEEDVQDIVLFRTSPQYLIRYEPEKDYKDPFLSAYSRLAERYDILIVEGTTFPYAMLSIGLDAASMAREMSCCTLVVSQPVDDYSLDEVIMLDEYLVARDIRVLGNVFNNVPRPLLDKTRGVFKPLVEKRGFSVLGVVPKRLEISAPTVGEFAEALGGEVLAAGERMDLVVEDILIGAMTLEAAMQYMRRSPNKALITGGDRSDLALAALETSTSAIILTGGLYPDVKVLARAEEQGVPVILVHHDTYTTIELLHKVSRKIRPDDVRGIALAKENVEAYCDWRAIFERLKE